jgi:lactate racemase
VNSAIRVPPRRRFKTVVTSSAGYPLDKTDYQTIKGMVRLINILEPGGALIVASECSEGFGSKEFRAAQRRLIELGPDKLLATLTAKSMADVDEWQTAMPLKSMRVGRISLYTSGLSDEERALTGVAMIADFDGGHRSQHRPRRGPLRRADPPKAPMLFTITTGVSGANKQFRNVVRVKQERLSVRRDPA